MLKTSYQAQRSTKSSLQLLLKKQILGSFLLSIVLSISSCQPALTAEVDRQKIQSLEKEIADLVAKQDYSRAAELAKEALVINENTSGKADAGNIPLLNNLGWLLQQNADLPAARELYERAVRLSEENKVEASMLAWSLNNLGLLLYSQGDYEAAKSKFEYALKASESSSDQSKTAQILKSLAGVYDALEKREEAIATYKKAIVLLEKAPDQDNADSKLQLAQLMEDMACSLEDKGQYEEVDRYLNGALAVKEKVLGKDNSELAGSLNNLGIFYLDTHKSDQAGTLFERALEVLKKSKGENHIDLVPVLNNLGDLAIITGDNTSAHKNYIRASRIINEYLSDIIPFLSLAEQHAALSLYCNDQVSRLLSTSQSPEQLKESYAEILAWKGTLASTLAQQSALRRGVDKSPELRNTFETLTGLRSAISSWYLEAGRTPLPEWKQKYDALTAEKEQLERSLAFSTKQESAKTPTLQNLLATLKEDEALVDIYKYDRFSRSESGRDLIKNSRYAAILIEQGQEPRLFDLSDSNNLQALVARWRNQVLSLANNEQSWKALSQILAEAPAQTSAGIKKLWICPDSELARIPWHLLSDEKGRMDTLHICHIDSARELLALKNKSKETPVASETLLAMGGVNFNAGAKDAEKAQMQMPYLAGTLRESRAVAELARASQFAVIELTGDAASKASLKKFLPESEYVHLATHGFFLDESMINSIRAQNETDKRSIVLKARYDSNLVRRNPLVESGIMLAGANKIAAQDKETRSGVFTAEEFVDTDLSKCKLLSLSACDTGRGQELTGQGVMGLRASIMAAGARNILMSIWKVPDEPTAVLMNEFYKNLWTRKLPAAQALKDAQSTLKKILPEGAHQAVNWAGWVLVGEGW